MRCDKHGWVVESQECEGCKTEALSRKSETTGSVCTVAVPFQALNMAQFLLAHKAKMTQNADLIRMVAELKEFEEALLYSESKPNDGSEPR